ncbi:MAG: hypothetical protein AAGE43_15495 [Pseudomonadota bacterium]
MLTRSLVAVFLSIPVTLVAIALFLAATPPEPALRLPSLLMVFPLWVAIACASYLLPKASTAAGVLVATAAVGYGLILLLQFMGVGGA